MDALWKKINPYFHVLTLVFIAGVAWAGVESAEQDIEKLRTENQVQALLITDMRISQARIEESLKEIKRALRIREDQ